MPVVRFVRCPDSSELGISLANSVAGSLERGIEMSHPASRGILEVTFLRSVGLRQEASQKIFLKGIGVG